MGDGLKSFSPSGHRRMDHVVEQQVAFIEPMLRSRDPDRPAAVLVAKLRKSFGMY
jgi:hypothetical protein